MKVYRATITEKGGETARLFKSKMSEARRSVENSATDDEGKRVRSITGYVDLLEFTGRPLDVVVAALNRDMTNLKAFVTRKWQLGGQIEREAVEVEI